jgi:hypothetical protein
LNLAHEKSIKELSTIFQEKAIGEKKTIDAHLNDLINEINTIHQELLNKNNK